MIFHITSKEEWETAKNNGLYISFSLKTEGFIHCSTDLQVLDTANLYYRGKEGLVLLSIDETKLDAECRFEPPASKHRDASVGKLFPHVYGHINLSAVVRVVDFPPNKDGLFQWPMAIKNLNSY